MADATEHSNCGQGSPDSSLTADDLADIVEESLAHVPGASRVLAIIPDKTRDDNTHLLFPLIAKRLASREVAIDGLVAQGTHAPMSLADKLAKIGAATIDEIPNLGSIYDHHWDDPDSLSRIGDLSGDEVERLTGRLLKEAIELKVNSLVASNAYDTILIIGGTTPHEVAGFSGGAKYFFPGVSGPDLTHKTHWLAALATIEKTIGRIETPTRHLMEAAADRIEKNVIAFTSVVSRDNDDALRTYALFAGDFRWSIRQAAAISQQVHIKYTGRRYARVVAILDEHYDDLWVGGKASYRLGAVIEDGGELIIYAPHLRCISDTHGADIEKFGGYAPLQNVKDLVARSGELQANLCVAAHLAHVSYAGREDADGKFVFKYRIKLASQVDAETCRRVNLEYLDPALFDPAEFADDPDTLVVERAGRDLYLVEPN
jgi:nickel-dependent lactate racemase